MTTPPFGIGIDTGGTFTDIVLFDLRRQRIVRKAKTPTTHGDYTVCIGLAFQALRLTAGETGALRRVCLSTTLATNTVAEDKVHPAALVMEPADIRVPPGFHPWLAVVRSRIGFDAVEVVPVSEREVLEQTRPLADAVDSFAVSGYASTRNPSHERQIAAVLRRAYGKPVVLGSELTHQLNFLQRALAAGLNAGLLPVILEWLEAVKGTLAGLRIGCPLYVVKGDGSLMEEQEALLRPVQTLFSGPAASLHGGQLLSGARDAVVIDVGGTTTDMGWVRGGRGLLRLGGIRINDRQIAVDGLDMATFGLAGDSHLRLSGQNRFRFESQRCLPFCRAAQRYPGFTLAALEAELAGEWQHGDPELIELAGLDQFRLGRGADGRAAPVLSGPQTLIVEELQQGPRRLKRLRQRVGESRFTEQIQDLIRKRAIVRIAFTPTDLFCAGGHAPAFSQADAAHALRLYARMLDCPAEQLEAALTEAVRRQAAAVLCSFLCSFEPPLELGGPVLERLVDLLLAPEGGAGATLALDAQHPIVLVGAGAAVLYGKSPASLARRMIAPADGDVANALGAITSSFLLRESVSVEPLRYGGVELYDHRGKEAFPTLPVALAEGRRRIETVLQERARALRLGGTELTWREEVIEDYAEFSKRTRKELVIARLEGVLTGMPE
jgi:N-methylhydantoinase A/oxoprolinase/acetone carboxylase beta subunit